MTETVSAELAAGWDFSYDAMQWVPLPMADERADEAASERWIAQAIARYADRGELAQGDRDVLAYTAEALLSFVEPYVVRLWFAPTDLYSDVLVSVVVTESDGEVPGQIAETLAEIPQTTASETVPIETDTHGSGVLIRRTSAVEMDGGEGMLIAHWDLLLRTGPWFIAVNATGTTLEAFSRLEPELLPLVQGISLPGVPA